MQRGIRSFDSKQGRRRHLSQFDARCSLFCPRSFFNRFSLRLCCRCCCTQLEARVALVGEYMYCYRTVALPLLGNEW